MKWWWQHKDEDLDAEIQSHLDLAVRGRMERGETAGVDPLIALRGE